MTSNRLDLFSLVHKGLRAELFATALAIGRTDFGVQLEAQRAADRVRRTLGYAEEHAGHEDAVVMPLLDRIAPGVGSDLRGAHARLDGAASEIARHVARLAAATRAERLALGVRPPAPRPRRDRAAPRHARRRQPFHRAVPRRGAACLGHAAQRLARRRQSHRHALHRPGQEGHEAAHAHPARQGLAYFTGGAQHFDDYVFAVGWAQRFARTNRDLMMAAILEGLARHEDLPAFTHGEVAVNCHHNYVQKEDHFGASVFVTRKGAVRAGLGELGIIPGSMGAKSFIVRGKGNPDSFHSCSHGAGRVMSRGETHRRFTVEDHIAATAGVECRKDGAVIDETPMAYKDIDAVMAAQSDLVEIVHTLKQVVCVKG